MPAHYAAPSKGVLTWRPTKIMNMRDLSKDDDFLSHLLVEKLGTGTVPLLVHKMDASRRLPKTDAQDLLQIVRRLVTTKGPVQHVSRQAVDELLLMPPIRYYLKQYTQKQINAFATHASRYFELYHPSGMIEIAHTSRYSHRTGKSELCILATRYLAPGTVITELKGSMAHLTEEEDKELKRTDTRVSDIRRDFSVIHSKQMKRNHLFLGPARFVNHDCDNNCELFREGRYITFRVIKPIGLGEEITAHYGTGYFGKKNRHCLCETCERRGRGGYAPFNPDDEIQLSDSDSDSDSDTDSDTTSDSDSGEGANAAPLNLNERRTRRGVYAVLKKGEESDDSDEEDDSMPLADATDVPTEGEIELQNEVEVASELTSLTSSRAVSNVDQAQSISAPLTNGSELTSLSRSTSLLSSLSSLPDLAPTSPQSNKSTPFRSIISTRRQKAKEAETSASASNVQLVSPPLTDDTVSVVEHPSTPSKRLTRSVSSLVTYGKNGRKGKGKASSLSTPTPKLDKGKGKEEVKVKKEETEPRIVRGRPSLPANPSETTKETAPVREIPKGPDGKPLPICATCSNVLPLIHVDSKVVWGSEVDSPSKSKKKRQDCPRCMRHLAIYGQAWPRRNPLPGTATFLPTPREEATPVDSPSRRVTHKELSTLNRKLAAAAAASSTPSKSRKSARSVSEERPAKRRKTDVGPRPEMSDRAKSKHALQQSASHPRRRFTSVAPQPEIVKRKRGRPRKVPLVPPSTEPVKAEESLDDPKPFKDQPRNHNGRFERKFGESASPRKVYSPSQPRQSLSRAERAVERDKHRLWLEQQDDDDESRKRMNDEDEEEEERERKRARREMMQPLVKVFRRPADFRVSNLFQRPSPMSFAVRAWAGVHLPDEESSEDDKGPVTPEDHLSPPATVVEIDSGEAGHDSLLSSKLVPPLSAGALTFKPTPFNFARRRWSSSLSTSPLDEETKRELNRLQSRNSLPNGGSALAIEDSIGGAEELSAKVSSALPSYTRWSTGEDSYSSEEEDLRNISPKAGQLSDGYPSALSSDEDDAPAIGLHKSSFASDIPVIAPTFIDAGWDSFSDSSDI